MSPRCARTPMYLADPGICSPLGTTLRLPRRDPSGAPRCPAVPHGAPGYLGAIPRAPPGAPTVPEGGPLKPMSPRCARTPMYLADPGICSPLGTTLRLPRRDPSGAPRCPAVPHGAPGYLGAIPRAPPCAPTVPEGGPRKPMSPRCARTPMYLADPGI